MSIHTRPQDLTPAYARDAMISRFMSKVYSWMTLGILLTGMVAMGVASNQEMMTYILQNKILFYGLMIAEVGMVIWLSAGINRMSSALASTLFFGYAALNGVTLSVISVVYTSSSIQSAFFISAIAFSGLSAFGYITKKDLGPVGSFCSMGLFGLIGFSILSLFFPSLMSGTADKVYGLVGLVVFAGLTAYDTQKIKTYASGGHKASIVGALKLYLDFINLFLFILRMQGNRK